MDCEKIIFDSKNQISEDGYSKSIKNKNFFVRFFQKFLSILSILKSNNDGVIVNSYLPLVYEKIFEIFLFQAPASWKFKKINYDMLDHNLRKKIILPLKKTKNLNNFIRENIKNFLPKSTVETFPKIIENAKNSNLPSNPKFIFTSNDFENNEIFKVYAAIKKSENKTTYIIGQHGNTYFTDLRSNKHRSELSFSDKFLSWGYEKKEKIHSAFNFLSLGKKKYKKQINNRLMLIISPLEFRMFPFNTIHQTEKGFSDSLDILNNLKNEISKNAIIRLHPSYHSKRGQYYVKKYFTKKNFSIDYGYESFVDARANSKISFFNYDSTGILENLALNYPTICMWDNFKNNLSDEFLSKYELLIKANILFLDKKDLVNHLNNIWQNIDKWWLSENTQKLIQEFNKDFNNRGNLFSLLKLRKNFFINMIKTFLQFHNFLNNAEKNKLKFIFLLHH